MATSGDIVDDSEVKRMMEFILTYDNCNCCPMGVEVSPNATVQHLGIFLSRLTHSQTIEKLAESWIFSLPHLLSEYDDCIKRSPQVMPQLVLRCVDV